MRFKKEKKNMIIYRVPENLNDSPEVRKAADSQFVNDLCESTFNIKLAPGEMLKIYRLGRPVEGPNARPLLVSFKSEAVKAEIMSNVRSLREASTRFKGIGIAHDLTPRQRTEVKKVLEEAKRAQETDPQQGNYKWIVVGHNTKPKVIKISK